MLLVDAPPSSMLIHMSSASPNSETDALVTGATKAPPQRKPASGQPRPDRQPPHGVVLHNDDVNTFDFVMACLRTVFGYTTPKAFLLTMRAHATGQAVIWVGMKEHAEFKAEQLSLCGPDPVMKGRGARPLGVSVVPLED